MTLGEIFAPIRHGAVCRGSAPSAAFVMDRELGVVPQPLFDEGSGHRQRVWLLPKSSDETRHFCFVGFCRFRFRRLVARTGRC
jgi:hypothetical protein